MKRILVGTTNLNKKKEMKKLLSSIRGLEVMGLDDLEGTPPIIIENGKTFRQNAVKKAIILSKFFDGLVISDDSGLAVRSLDGKPGVRSARFSRKNATDIENNEKLLKLMGKVPSTDRSAKFICCIALAKNGSLLETSECAVKGSIIEKPRGNNGFGYDPLFVPDGHHKTFAEMTESYKNRISHRALALKKTKQKITKHLKAS